MAFNLQAIVNAVTYELNDGSPFNMEGLRGGGIASARRLSERGPLQHGDTDLGVRLQPRTITLSLNFSAASASALDTARDELNTIFKPVGETVVNYPVQLRITRDDGGVRQLDCYLTGPADIPLIPINRPGNLHRAVIQLRASDPLWYDPTQVTTVLSVLDAEWQLGYGSIGTANVLEATADGTVGQPWTYGGTVANSAGWSIAAMSTAMVSEVNKRMWGIGTSDTGDNALYMRSRFDDFRLYSFWFYNGTGREPQLGLDQHHAEVITMVTHEAAQGLPERIKWWTNEVAGELADTSTGALGEGIGPANRFWAAGHDGGEAWPHGLKYAAVYDIELSADQRANLRTHMLTGSAGASGGTVQYGGSWIEYPVMTVLGPISDPVITNHTTGEKLDFTGYTIGAGVTYTIDTRYGAKSVTDSGGTSQIAQLSDDSDLGSFHLSAPPYATGSVNSFSLVGTAITGGVTLLTVQHFNRYTSF